MGAGSTSPVRGGGVLQGGCPAGPLLPLVSMRAGLGQTRPGRATTPAGQHVSWIRGKPGCADCNF